MAFIDEIKERARAEKKRIILPEGMDRRVWEAAVTVIKENVADVTIIATEEEVKEFSEGLEYKAHDNESTIPNSRFNIPILCAGKSQNML